MPLALQLLGAADVVDVVGIAAVDQDVALLRAAAASSWIELVDDRRRAPSARRPRSASAWRRSPRRAGADGLAAALVDDVLDGLAWSRSQTTHWCPPRSSRTHHVAAHATQTDHSQLHGSLLSGLTEPARGQSRSFTLRTLSPSCHSTTTASAMPRNRPVPTTPGIARMLALEAGRIGDRPDAAVEDVVAVVGDVTAVPSASLAAARRRSPRLSGGAGTAARRTARPRPASVAVARRARVTSFSGPTRITSSRARRGDDLLADQGAAQPLIRSSCGSTSSAPSTSTSSSSTSSRVTSGMPSCSPRSALSLPRSARRGCEGPAGRAGPGPGRRRTRRGRCRGRWTCRPGSVRGRVRKWSWHQTRSSELRSASKC